MIDRFMAWLDKVLPWQCVTCGKWYMGHYHEMTTTWGAKVKVCERCYRILHGGVRNG